MDVSEGLPSLKGFARVRQHQREEKRIVKSICTEKGLDEDRLYELIRRKAGALVEERTSGEPNKSPDDYVDTLCGAYLEVVQDLEKMPKDDIEAEIAFDLLSWQ